jgi:hypothetical protein
MGYHFVGSQGQATKQIGNAFPPVVASTLYRTIAKTLEAFDNGYIDAEEDISDLDALLERKGARLQAPPEIPRAAFNSPARSASLPSRYLVRDERSETAMPEEHKSASRTRHREEESIDLLDGLFDGANDTGDGHVRANTQHRRAGIIQNASREIIEISSESEEDMDEDEGDSD